MLLFKHFCLGADNGSNCDDCEAIIAKDPDINLARMPCKCRCQVILEEANCHAIALAIKKNKDKEVADAKPPPAGTTTSLFYQHVDRTLTNESGRQG